MGPLIPVALAIAAWGCSSRYGVDENPIVTDAGRNGKDVGTGTGKDAADASSYSDVPHVDLPRSPDGYSPDGVAPDLFAGDTPDVLTPDVPTTDIITTDIPPDVDVPTPPKLCTPKVTLPTSCAVSQIAAGGNLSCFIKSGAVYCAGKINSSANPLTSIFNSSIFSPIPSLAGAQQIAVGGAHLCAIMPQGDVKCLGQNIWGQLGDGSTLDAKAAVTVLNYGGATSISLGAFHSMGINSSGQVHTWGLNSGGQLGIATMPLKCTTPQGVALDQSAFAARSGAIHSVALLADGSAFAWGNNALFPLGVGATNKVLTPMLMQNSKQGIRIAAGEDFTLLLDQNCTVSAVGAGGMGQLGLESNSNAATLTPIPSLSGIAAVVAGGQHACAITQDGALFCWGEAKPAPLAGISSVAQASLGTHHGIALDASCKVFVWGKNNVGQLGLGNTTDAPAPTPVTIN